ncbi:MAG: DNA polymerase III subunit beta [Candidatus Omnitrophica bacterium]|nr:DNA polymerase III subunit beta [Candidatus Omnitrophota bacterium]
MKIRIEKEPLVKAMQMFQNIISAKVTLPILSNLLIETQKGKVHMAATDLDISISLNLPVEVIEEGGITIPAKKFFDIARDLPEGQIEITVRKNNSITIESQKCFFKIMGLPKEEFPKLPKLHEKESVTLNQQLLKNMLSLTCFAASRDETRYILNGVLLVAKGKGIRLVATDGRRLALIEKEVELPGDLKREAIIPTKAIQELIRNLQDEGLVKIVFGENQISFQFDNTVLVSRLIEGQFPNYEQVIPKEGKGKIIINREKFLWAAKRASILTSPDSQSIKLDLFKDKLIFSKNSPDMGEAKEEIDIQHKGEELSVGFNPQYLIDVLKGLKDEAISLELTGPESPGIIRVQEDYVYIILPMQLS